MAKISINLRLCIYLAAVYLFTCIMINAISKANGNENGWVGERGRVEGAVGGRRWRK